tara:strand:- start:540 stop:1157 length:618 start_codon:yes stop_codon:yes gene_type:complete
MNYNKERKLIYWGTAGCGSRTNIGVFDHLGDRYTCMEKGTFKFGTSTHQQGIPPGCEGYEIICMIRNPYTRAMSAYLDLLQDGVPSTFKEYCFGDRYLHWPNDVDLHYWHQWKELGTPNWFIRLEHMIEDWESIPNLMDNIEGWEDFKVSNIIQNNHSFENKFDEYDENGHQKVTKYMDQEVADLIYEKDKIIFEIGNYNKDSWK